MVPFQGRAVKLRGCSGALTVIWFAGFFGKNVIDEDAVEMLGSLPVDRALSILTNIEETESDAQKATTSIEIMEIQGNTPPMARLPQEIAGPNKVLLRETNG